MSARLEQILFQTRIKNNESLGPLYCFNFRNNKEKKYYFVLKFNHFWIISVNFFKRNCLQSNYYTTVIITNRFQSLVKAILLWDIKKVSFHENT